MTGVHQALALFGDAKQAMGEGKSGPVETGLNGPVATALTQYFQLVRDGKKKSMYSWSRQQIVFCGAFQAPQ